MVSSAAIGFLTFTPAESNNAQGSNVADITSIPGWQDMTGAELVAFSQANPQTATAYPVEELVNWLRENNLAYYGLDSSWQGILPVIAQNEQTPIEFRQGLVAMLSHLRNPKAVQVDTHLDAYAPLLGALLASTGLSAEQIAEFYERDGGRKYPVFASAEAATEAKDAALVAEAHAADRDAAIESTAGRINAASEARRAAIDNAESTGAEIIAATVEAFG